MPQEFQILRCYSCEKFQVHQTKKAKTWQCKVCGEKQSLKKAYFIGSAKDCRINVQKLNFEDGQKKQDKMLQQNYESFDEDSLFDFVDENNDAYALKNIPNDSIEQSWNDTPSYLDNQSSPCMPKKKRKYAEDPLSDIFSEDASYNVFEELKEDVHRTLEKPCQETSISFDVSFDSNSANSCTDTSTFETSDAPLKFNNENDKNVSTEPAVKKGRDFKNRGFQLIMNAAKKLSADSEIV
ncbi:hypothetical protein JTE90_006037 [Oedothorax gibbosus]|uniref:MRN complex-interacting protein N-terminal domain-containing protein n=1 Tax=Oedothorax gibbosus TaxID=931172 RepID=A0AAV6V0V6_9ARAC|nr:hypothetical protein JTE90_006037 [Oedothorax gibbosus]